MPSPSTVCRAETQDRQWHESFGLASMSSESSMLSMHSHCSLGKELLLPTFICLVYLPRGDCNAALWSSLTFKLQILTAVHSLTGAYYQIIRNSVYLSCPGYHSSRAESQVHKFSNMGRILGKALIRLIQG